MQKRPSSWYSKLTLAAAGITGFAMLLGAPQLRADDCQKRVNRADHQLHEAIEHHGYNSEQSEHARHELSEAREYCWGRDHRWWDPDDNRWHDQHDWDDNDHRDYGHHDRDNDHHDNDDDR